MIPKQHGTLPSFLSSFNLYFIYIQTQDFQKLLPFFTETNSLPRDRSTL
jgi:hypothetical protein